MDYTTDNIDKKAQEAWELRKSLASASHIVNMWDTFIEGYKQGYKDNQPKLCLHTVEDLLPKSKYTPEVIDALYGPESLYTTIKEKVLDVGTTVYVVHMDMEKYNRSMKNLKIECEYIVSEDVITNVHIDYNKQGCDIRYRTQKRFDTMILNPTSEKDWWHGGIFLTKEEAQECADKINNMPWDDD